MLSMSRTKSENSECIHLSTGIQHKTASWFDLYRPRTRSDRRIREGVVFCCGRRQLSMARAGAWNKLVVVSVQREILTEAHGSVSEDLTAIARCLWRCFELLFRGPFQTPYLGVELWTKFKPRSCTDAFISSSFACSLLFCARHSNVWVLTTAAVSWPTWTTRRTMRSVEATCAPERAFISFPIVVARGLTFISTALSRLCSIRLWMSAGICPTAWLHKVSPKSRKFTIMFCI